MRFITPLSMTGLFTVASAHFKLQYPPPRGVFVEDTEPNFCGGYSDAVPNRTIFPTAGGFVSIDSEHPKWTVGGVLSTVQDPNNFDTFKDSSGNDQQAFGFFKTTGEGAFCFNIDLAARNISGVKDGANVTIQIVFDGGDGALYQCADLTLSDNATIPSSVSCTNATNSVATPVSSSVTASSTSTSTSNSNSTSTNNNNGALRNTAIGVSGFAGLLGAAIALF